MKRTGFVIGGLLVVGATIFVIGEVAVAIELHGTPPRGDGIEGMSFAIYDLYGLQTFYLLHIWVVWSLVRMWWAGFGLAKRQAIVLVGYAGAVLVVGHILAAWLNKIGVWVGV